MGTHRQEASTILLATTGLSATDHLFAPKQPDSRAWNRHRVLAAET